MRCAVIIFVLLMPLPVVAQDQPAKPCFCINRDGEKVELGQLACLRVGGKSFMARCSMSLNLLTWRKVSDGCLSSQISSPQHMVSL
ncbi:hypothetical protein [uncultured Pelagimonas sp.]|uniref:hypothetical protein n=1 Tax=uncultured Pelagimonas sp. TaxID=1618102 RepID=UPI002605020C|nr:hypothetical protein [uncultured Pelagimonas sp.]